AIGHEETPGDPGFTGVTVRDRLAAQGYADAMASEVAASSDSGTEDVRFLWDLPYHRLGLMHPHAVLAGWGHAEIDGHTATVGVLVFDFAAVAPDHVRSPAAGQHVTGSWAGDESPDALPPGAVRPVGYPVMVVYSSARPVDLKNAKLTDASGRGVELFELRTRHGRFRGALREQLQYLRIRERREGRGHQRPDAFVDDALDRILAASCSGSGAPQRCGPSVPQLARGRHVTRGAGRARHEARRLQG